MNFESLYVGRNVFATSCLTCALADVSCLLWCGEDGVAPFSSSLAAVAWQYSRKGLASHNV